jgi:ubiquinone/menaquinone biosynthesis C-methylase UbiE/acyl carrier protein
MAYQSSYKINEFALNTKSEIERLEAQVDLFWEKELSLYKLSGLENGMAIVECGCGTGIVGRKLCQSFPECKITAFDIDPILVETARNNAQSLGLDNYEVFELPILETGLPSNTYDFAIARLVLEHLSNPVDAIKEVFRILKPNRKAVFIDNDFEFHLRTHPDLPELKDLYDAYCRARQDDGGNPKIGRELPNLLKHSGFINIDLQIISAHSSIVGDSIFLKSEGSGIPAKLLRDGYLSGEIYTKIAQKWNRLLRTDGHSLFRQLFFCVGVKPLQKPIEKTKETARTVVPELLAEKRTSSNMTEVGNKIRAAVRQTEFNVPTGSTEDQIAFIWSKVLNRAEIAPDENFFEAGGSSLYALEIVDFLQKQFQKKISIIDIFENPTISLLAKLFKQDHQQKAALTPEQRKAARIIKIKERRDNIRRLINS